MPIRIEVMSCGDAPPSQPIAAEFDELGGSIGRGSDSSLVLPDPERFISRTHASVEFRAGRYVIVDKGKSMPVQVNGRALGQGVEAAIADGDEIVIGSYRMRVTAIASGVQAVPPPSSVGPAKDDPLALFGAPAATPPLRQPPPAAAAPARTPSILDDPFAQPLPATGDVLLPNAASASASGVSGPTPHLPDDFDFGLGLAGPSANIDEAFGLSPRGIGDPFPPSSPLAENPIGPSVDDPLAAFGIVGSVPASVPQRNDTPELQGSFRVPKARPEIAPLPPESRPSEPPPPPASVGISTPGPEIIDPLALFGGAPSIAPQGVASASSARAVSGDALAAFLQGAGVPSLQVPGGLTPETMRQLGQVFREAVQGTLDLLLARATIKREVRADMTLIVGRENNPLKFSPNVETALAHLLAPQAPGFKAPLEAMKDAYNDLRSHQFGFMAGMRAALTSVLQRFDPVNLERRLTDKSVMDSVLPMNRRAKLWDLFQSLYGDISKEAEDDFHTLFGREFLRAYQAQIERLTQEEGNNRN